MSVEITTFNVQRFSTEDGPGIRTTVFLKGCPLSCPWCHNPEGLSTRPELVWYDARCVGARDCLSACPEQALELTPEGMRIERTRCTVCGDCGAACPSAALEVVGKRWSLAVLLAEIEKDRVFFETSGGGVTLSGGEPMLQREATLALAAACHDAGLRVALDTCGAVGWSWYERILPDLDLVLYDLKIFDAERHRAAVGAANAGILENARRISAAGVPMWIRTPIIPGYTAEAANIEALARFIAGELPTVARWDLLAYTNLGGPKYGRLGRVYALDGARLPDRASMEELTRVARAHVASARWSGATRD